MVGSAPGWLAARASMLRQPLPSDRTPSQQGVPGATLAPAQPEFAALNAAMHCSRVAPLSEGDGAPADGLAGCRPGRELLSLAPLVWMVRLSST